MQMCFLRKDPHLPARLSVKKCQKCQNCQECQEIPTRLHEQSFPAVHKWFGLLPARPPASQLLAR